MGFITTSFSMDSDTYYQMEMLRDKLNYTRSRYIQNALKRENRRVSRIEISEFLDNCSDEDIETLKNEIKKREL